MKIRNYFFLGIGGIGNSALAQHFTSLGHLVAGYDRIPSGVTQKLEKNKLDVLYEFAPEKLPSFVDPENTTIVCTAAIKQDQPWYQYFEKKGYLIEKRAHVLAQIANAKICVAVAGTHGKTTTLAILSHIFKTAKQSFTAFVGGILQGYESNYIHTGDSYILVEADEFDRSFLKLRPTHAAITSIDPDHHDIYHSKKAFEKAFEDFANHVEASLIVGPGVALEGLKIGTAATSPYRMENCKLIEEGYLVDFYLRSPNSESFLVDVVGQHNLYNALTAAALATECGISISAIREALKSFQGIHRRMNIYPLHINTILVDDYAHHPTEIRAVFKTLNERYPELKKTVVFQPHLYSRTQNFLDAFATALSLFDQIYLLPIYPAREQPIAGVSSLALLDQIKQQNKGMISKEEIVSLGMHPNQGIIALLGAGDIGEVTANFKKVIA